MDTEVPRYRSAKEAVHEIFGAELSDSRSVGGGCISATSVISLSDGRRLFIKRDPSSRGASTFREEAEGLRALKSIPGPRVPRVYGFWDGSFGRYLLMEYIEHGSGGSDAQRRLGRELAAMHGHDAGHGRFGFHHDNFIGATEQPNPWCDSWLEFFANHRIRFQVELARRRGLLDAQAERDAERVVGRLQDLIPEPDHPSLLHGDLWGGNYLTTPDGEPVLIDPAVYYGNREADIAMTELFGGFGRAFYDAYNQEYPLAPGYRDRSDLYNLYHLLNHLNIFGSGYLGGVKSTLAGYG